MSTLAGSAGGAAGWADGPPSAALFSGVAGVAVDPSTGATFVGDSLNHRIRRISPDGTSVATVAGMGSPGAADSAVSGTLASFNRPSALAFDASGATLYVADFSNGLIRSVSVSSPPGGTPSPYPVSTFAGRRLGPGKAQSAAVADGDALSTATFYFPTGLAVHPSTGTVFVTDLSHAVRAVSAGTVSTLAGCGRFAFSDGAGTAACFAAPAGVAVFPDPAAPSATGQATLYVADQGNNRIRNLTVAAAAAGGGGAGRAPAVVGTFAGSGAAGFSDGPPLSAAFSGPAGVAVSARDGSVWVADAGNAALRLVAPPSASYPQRVVVTVAGGGGGGAPAGSPAPPADGLGPAARFKLLSAVSVDMSSASSGQSVVISDRGLNAVLRARAPAPPPPQQLGFFRPPPPGRVARGYSVIGRVADAISYSSTTEAFALDRTTGVIYYVLSEYYAPPAAIGQRGLYTLSPDGFRARRVATAGLRPGLSLDESGRILSVCATDGGIVQFDTTTWAQTRFSNGTTCDMLAQNPATGDFFTLGKSNNVVKLVSAADRTERFLAGSPYGLSRDTDGTGTAAGFSAPVSIVFSRVFGAAFVADMNNYRVRRVTPDGVVTTFAGSLGVIPTRVAQARRAARAAPRCRVFLPSLARLASVTPPSHRSLTHLQPRVPRSPTAWAPWLCSRTRAASPWTSPRRRCT